MTSTRPQSMFEPMSPTALDKFTRLGSRCPFITDPLADVIITSCDEVDFRVQKGILSIASPYFQQELASLDGQGETKDDLPVVHITEDSDTFDSLLRILYPIRSPTFFAEGEHVERVLAAALKYDMAMATQELCSALLAGINSSKNGSGSSSDGGKVSAGSRVLALRVYAIACRYGLREEARAAARACLRFPVVGAYFLELESIPAGAYFRLLEYHQQVVNVVLPIFAVDKNAFPAGLPQDYGHVACCEDCGGSDGAPASDSSAASWWMRLAARAVEVLHVSPLSEEIYSTTFVAPFLQAASKCESCKGVVHGKWHTLAQVVKEEINRRVSAIELDVEKL